MQATFLAILLSLNAHAEGPEAAFPVAEGTLHARAWSDEVLQFEFRRSNDPEKSALFQTSPYVAKTRGLPDFSGPQEFTTTPDGFRTKALNVRVDQDGHCVEVARISDDEGREPTRLCAEANKKGAGFGGFTLARGSTRAAYGLGEYFDPARLGQANGDWLGRRRVPGNGEGNAMIGFHGGATGNAQFPVFYALRKQAPYGLFVDELNAQSWDLTGDPFRVSVRALPLRIFYLGGKTLPEVRSNYMRLTGYPPVPPRKAFGLWVSEYGFNDWNELRSKLKTLRANQFPVDGFVLDLQWFGGVKEQSPFSSMGKIRFDETKFPRPRQTIAELRRQGIGLVTIEEPYVSSGLPEFRRLEKQGFLLREHPARRHALVIDENPWWGVGGMVDYTNSDGAKLWHDWKRQPLTELGILGHWTDLGEPEMYRRKGSSRTGYYAGIPELGRYTQAEVHNAYGLFWAESIYDGYRRRGVARRPWILARSGGSGIQRYGTAMWSADIGSNFGSLNSHLNAQLQMSFSGMDYFGSDLGGFHRSGAELEPGVTIDDLYTQWFAIGAAFDVPMRPHTENVANTKETAPDRVGHLESNRENLRQRVRLTPYYYSLAHAAYLYGDPIVPPIAYYYADAPVVDGMDPRQIGAQKLIGRDLLAGAAPAKELKEQTIYLPPGEWVDYLSGAFHASERGQTLKNFPLWRDGLFRLPLFAKGGAVIPEMHVDERTQNVEGKQRDELIVRAFPSATGVKGEFTLYEDDGETVAYERGAVARTFLEQRFEKGQRHLEIAATAGRFAGQKDARPYRVAFVLRPEEASATCSVKLNGKPLALRKGPKEFEAAVDGAWLEQNVFWAKSRSLTIRSNKTFVLDCASKASQ